MIINKGFHVYDRFCLDHWVCYLHKLLFASISDNEDYEYTFIKCLPAHNNLRKKSRWHHNTNVDDISRYFDKYLFKYSIHDIRIHNKYHNKYKCIF